MKILGLDTSDYINAIGVVADGKVLAKASFPARSDSLEKIIIHIDGVLKEAGLKLEDIDGYGVGLGPGSWTGIRVGVTVAKILAFSTSKPIAGIATLEILACNAKKPAGLICAAINAGTPDALYTGFYRKESGTTVKQGDYYIGNLKGLAELIREPVLVAGPEAEKYAGELNKLCTNQTIDFEITSPDGAVAALLAEKRLVNNEADNVLALAPLYLKESAARVFKGWRPEEAGKK